jgi:hypothetical protein
MTEPIKSPGRLAYEADCTAQPFYHDGARRRTWDQIGDAARQSWERNPTPRKYPNTACGRKKSFTMQRERSE